MHVARVVINHRDKNPQCNIAVNKALETGDLWISEGSDGDAMQDELAEVAKLMAGKKSFNYTQVCVRVLVHVDVVTEVFLPLVLIEDSVLGWLPIVHSPFPTPGL